MIINIADFHDEMIRINTRAKSKGVNWLKILEEDTLSTIVASKFITEIKTKHGDHEFIPKNKFISILKHVEYLEVSNINIHKISTIAEQIALKYVRYIKAVLKLNPNLNLEKNSILDLLVCIMFAGSNTPIQFKTYNGFIEYLNEYGGDSCGIILADSLLTLIYFSTTITSRFTNSTYLVKYCFDIDDLPTNRVDDFIDVINKPKIPNSLRMIDSIKLLATKNEKWFIFSMGYLFLILWVIGRMYYLTNEHVNNEDALISLFIFLIFLVIAYIGAAILNYKKMNE